MKKFLQAISKESYQMDERTNKHLDRHIDAQDLFQGLPPSEWDNNKDTKLTSLIDCRFVSVVFFSRNALICLDTFSHFLAYSDMVSTSANVALA